MNEERWVEGPFDWMQKNPETYGIWDDNENGNYKIILGHKITLPME